MAEQYAKRRGREGNSRFVKIEHYLLKSLAYRSLTPKARALYVEFKLLYNGSNNGKIHMGVREAAKAIGCANNTAKKAIEELIDKGFIKYHFKGVFVYKIRHSSEFILTEYEYNNKLPTKDFMRWKPE